MIYFASDSHAFHSNMTRGVSTWDSGYRDFNTVEEMTSAIIEGINKTVKEDDILYHLGDWSFGGIDKIWKFRKEIKCKNIYLILGNHDDHIRNNKQILIDKSDKELYESLLDKKLESLTVEGNYWEYCRKFFSSINDVLQIKLEGQRFFLSHYAHRVWNHSHKGVIHLYGHSHDSLDRDGVFNGKSMDVGVDSAFRILGEYRPFSLEEVKRIMNKRQVCFIDHHKENTN